jgi:hypothetical protein
MVSTHRLDTGRDAKAQDRFSDQGFFLGLENMGLDAEGLFEPRVWGRFRTGRAGSCLAS